MSAGHHRSHHGLYLDQGSPVHGLPAAAKVAGLVLYVVSVALTPRTAVAALAANAVVVAAVVVLARLPVRTVITRAAAVLPFVAFAFVLPFVATGERTPVLGISVAVDGLWATWNIVAKAFLGATAGLVLTATTRVPDLLAGLGRLRVPAVVVAIVAFMLRYLELVVDEFGRMRRAMLARAYAPRWIWEAKPVASSVGTLFVRTYERGERVHQAMVARGFKGVLPPPVGEPSATLGSTLGALVPGVLAAGLLAASLLAR